MGRRALGYEAGKADDDEVIAVVARSFDILRCFRENRTRLGNKEIAEHCGLPRSTVSRLTQTLTRLGHLVYLPDEQKYCIGPAAIAQSTAILRHAPARRFARDMIEALSKEISGTVGLTCHDGADMVYIECARAYDAVALYSTVGTRVSTARSSSGQAYAASLPNDTFEALAKRIGRLNAEEARIMRSRVAANRRSLSQHGYVLSVGVWHPAISGIGVPIWSERYRTWIVITCGVLSTTYGVRKLRETVAPRLIEAAALLKDFDLDLTPSRPLQIQKGKYEHQGRGT